MSNSLNKSKSKAKAAVTADVFTGMISKITGIYVLLMMAVFPLFATDMYYNVLNDKYYFFFYSTAAAAAISLMILLVGIAGGALRKQKDGSRPLAEIFRLTLPDKILLVFFGVVTVSTLASEWLYEAFWGNVGRLQGMFFFIIVLVSWFLVTKFYRFRPAHLYAFFGAGILVCLWGISDYVGMDIFGWRADANDYWNMLSFTSSIGNVNTFTAIVALYFGGSAVLCLGKKNLWFYYPAFFIAALALIAGQSDNALLAIVGTFGLLPFYIAEDVKRISGYVFLLALFALSLSCAGLAYELWPEAMQCNEWMMGVLVKISVSAYQKLFVIALLLAALGVGLLVFFRTEKFKAVEQKPFFSVPVRRLIWGGVCLAVLLFVAYCVYDANTAGKLTFLQPYYSYLVFNDRWGTNRGYAWRSSFEFFKEFSLFKKLFGSGPETYGIFMAKNYYYEMMDFMGSVFDSPHSEPIQYLFTTGILGFVSFYSLVAVCFVRGLKNGGAASAFAFAFAAYICASLINISVPISTPLLFLCMELASALKENEETV